MAWRTGSFGVTANSRFCRKVGLWRSSIAGGRAAAGLFLLVVGCSSSVVEVSGDDAGGAAGLAPSQGGSRASAMVGGVVTGSPSPSHCPDLVESADVVFDGATAESAQVQGLGFAPGPGSLSICFAMAEDNSPDLCFRELVISPIPFLRAGETADTEAYAKFGQQKLTSGPEFSIACSLFELAEEIGASHFGGSFEGNLTSDDGVVHTISGSFVACGLSTE